MGYTKARIIPQVFVYVLNACIQAVWCVHCTAKKLPMMIQRCAKWNISGRYAMGKLMGNAVCMVHAYMFASIQCLVFSGVYFVVGLFNLHVVKAEINIDFDILYKLQFVRLLGNGDDEPNMLVLRSGMYITILSIWDLIQKFYLTQASCKQIFCCRSPEIGNIFIKFNLPFDYPNFSLYTLNARFYPLSR